LTLFGQPLSPILRCTEFNFETVVRRSKKTCRDIEPRTSGGEITGYDNDSSGNQHGFVGAPLPVVESFGSTSLVEVGENYFLDSISSGTGPELQYQGRTGLQVVISCRKTPTLLDLIEESIDQVARAIRLRAEAD
jgi:hypothetical protein